MKLLNVLKSTKNKIIFLFILSFLVFALWQTGLERIYQKSLVNSTNFVLKIVKKDTFIKLEENKNQETIFKIYTKIKGRRASFPQKSGGLNEPFVIILAWQLFLFFVLNTKTAVKLAIINMLIFYFIQILLLIFLTGYYSSKAQQFIFDMMTDNFYIVALILVIKDNILYQVFKKH